MEKSLTTFSLFFLLVASPAFGQNGNGKLLKSSVYHSINTSNGDVLLRDSILYVYDTENNLVDETKWQDIYFLQDVGGSRHLRTYDNKGNVLTQIEKILQNNQWVNATREINTYDSSDLLITKDYSNWQGNAWVSGSTYQYSYNANGQIISLLTDSFRNFYTYNNQNKIDTITSQRFSNGVWTNSGQGIYTYDTIAGANTITEIELQWSGTSWDNYFKTTQTFDSHGNLVLEILENWENTTHWELNARRSWAYDNNQNPVYLLEEWRVGSVWVNNAQTNYEYDTDADIIHSQTDYWINDDWRKRRSYNYYYYTPASINPVNLSNFMISPNPAATSITLRSEGLAHAKLFDQQGHLMRSQSLQGQAEESFQLGNLPTGNYLLQVLDSEGRAGVKPLQIRH